jgi:hypothetical protein
VRCVATPCCTAFARGYPRLSPTDFSDSKPIRMTLAEFKCRPVRDFKMPAYPLRRLKPTVNKVSSRAGLRGRCPPELTVLVHTALSPVRDCAGAVPHSGKVSNICGLDLMFSFPHIMVN